MRNPFRPEQRLSGYDDSDAKIVHRLHEASTQPPVDGVVGDAQRLTAAESARIKLKSLVPGRDAVLQEDITNLTEQLTGDPEADAEIIGKIATARMMRVANETGSPPPRD